MATGRPKLLRKNNWDWDTHSLSLVSAVLPAVLLHNPMLKFALVDFRLLFIGSPNLERALQKKLKRNLFWKKYTYVFLFIFQVTCTGNFMQKFPVEELRHDQVEILIIGKKNRYMPYKDRNKLCILIHFPLFPYHRTIQCMSKSRPILVLWTRKWTEPGTNLPISETTQRIANKTFTYSQYWSENIMGFEWFRDPWPKPQCFKHSYWAQFWYFVFIARAIFEWQYH